MPKTKTPLEVLFLCLCLSLIAAPIEWVSAQSNTQGSSHNMHGNMSGFMGEDATRQESGELMVMLHHFDVIERSVENLPDGIRTITYSGNPRMMDVIISHVTGMVARMEEGRDPKVGIQSPTLDIIFARRDVIETEIEITDAGIVVTQTSRDPELVEALQVHAAEVSDMVARGMAAVHDMARKRQ